MQCKYQYAPVLYTKDYFEEEFKKDTFNIKKLYKRFAESIYQFIGGPMGPIVCYNDNGFTVRYLYLTNELHGEPVKDSDEIYVLQEVAITMNIEFIKGKHHIEEDSWTREFQRMKEEKEKKIKHALPKN